MYISEVSPIKFRGAFGAPSPWAFLVGLFLSSVLGFQEVYGNKENWQNLFVVPFVFAAAQLFILPFCPESPQFLLIERKDSEGALVALRKFRGAEYPIEKEQKQIIMEDERSSQLPDVRYCDFLTKPLVISNHFPFMG